ncbi:MAG: hypothetical protein ABI627_02115 [Polyangiaceae bacterium]
MTTTYEPSDGAARADDSLTNTAGHDRAAPQNSCDTARQPTGT